ncbi:MAG: hypothetical protein ACHBN1_15520 [Heteroscytonema crispum UTEX LB 1556]
MVGSAASQMRDRAPPYKNSLVDIGARFELHCEGRTLQSTINYKKNYFLSD